MNLTPQSLAPANSAPPAPPATAGGRVWRVGTLVYTGSSLAALYAWLLWGDFAWQLKERTGPMVQVMLGKYQASDFLTAIFMISLPAIISMTVGPIVGYWSDRHRGPRGRRIPFLLATTPIAALALVGVGCGPLIGGWLHEYMAWAPESRYVTILSVMAAFWTLFEIATVTANTVFGGLINDVVPRELIGRFFGLFRVISLGVGILLYYFVMGYSKEYYMAILVTVAAVYALGFSMMCLKVKEGEYPPVEIEKGARRQGFFEAVKGFFRCCFADPYYLTVFGFMALAVTSFIPINLYMVFAAQSFGLSLDTYGKYMALMFAGSLLIAYPLGCLADRFHATRVGLTCLVCYALATGSAFFFVQGPLSFGVMLVAHGVLSACYNTGVSALGQMLFPKDKFGQFAAAATFLASLASIIASPLVGLLLGWLGRDYRFTFGLSCLLALFALLLGSLMYRQFRALGGPKNYEAP